jgi:CheY-like chemotaxis protein
MALYREHVGGGSTGEQPSAAPLPLDWAHATQPMEPSGQGDDQLGHGPDQREDKAPRKRFSRVLVVDDDEGVARQLCYLLEDEGYEVEVAKTGRAALAAANEGSFDVAILDVRLPDLSGIEVFEAFRLRASSVKTIIVSGFLVDEEIARAETRGAHFLAKPVDAVALLDLLSLLESGKGDGR